MPNQNLTILVIVVSNKNDSVNPPQFTLFGQVVEDGNSESFSSSDDDDGEWSDEKVIGFILHSA